jgi:predicted DCC family thiol-disulfide oxidoreductase YuxK
MAASTIVIYNANCPICAREINGYRRYCADRALPVAFRDLDRADLDALGLTPEDAARRLHVIQNGTLLAGTPAFLALWSAMPRFRPLARIVSLPGLRQIATLVYEGLAAPALYAMHRRRVARQARAGR